MPLDTGTEWIAPATVAGRDARALAVDDESPVVKRTCLVHDFADNPVLYDETFQTGVVEITTRRGPVPTLQPHPSTGSG